jgi:hypothetical protein
MEIAAPYLTTLLIPFFFVQRKYQVTLEVTPLKPKAIDMFLF